MLWYYFTHYYFFIIFLTEYNKDCNFKRFVSDRCGLKTGGKMKKVFILLIALLMALALFGCNITPNVPRVTPYGTNTTRSNNYSGSNGLYGVTGNPGTNGNGMSKTNGTGTNG